MWFCRNKIAPIEFPKYVTLVLFLHVMFLYLILITPLHTAVICILTGYRMV